MTTSLAEPTLAPFLATFFQTFFETTYPFMELLRSLLEPPPTETELNLNTLPADIIIAIIALEPKSMRKLRKVSSTSISLTLLTC